MNPFAIGETATPSPSPAWCRARITAINRLLEKLPASEEKNSPRTLLRNGYIQDQIREQFDELLDNEYKLTFALNEPLTFRELTSFNTWFVMHPEKVCGKEVLTTSLQFPITIQGTKEDILRCIGHESDQKSHQTDQKRSPNGQKKDQNGNETDQNEHDFDQNRAQKGTNRFGESSIMLVWKVSYFHSFYREQVDDFNREQKPLDEKIEALEQSIIDAKGDKVKRKELIEQFNKAAMLRSDLWREFENQWLDFCLGLRSIILERASKLGIEKDEDDTAYMIDDIFVAFGDRPGIEHYWNNTISEVIDSELRLYAGKNQQPGERDAMEIEALALEVELQLLKMK